MRHLLRKLLTKILKSYLQRAWQTLLSQTSFTAHVLSLKQTFLQNFPSHTCWSGHSALLAQVTGWRTQPTTGVGLGMNPAGQVHWARWLTTWQLACGPQESTVHGSIHLQYWKLFILELKYAPRSLQNSWKPTRDL